MPCTFPNEPIDVTPEEWHALESYFDSATGKSPLVQLCRITSEVYQEFEKPAIDFHRMGTVHDDTILAQTDYEANPDWNPYYDFATILTECKTYISQMVYNGFAEPFKFIQGDDCHRRYVADRATIYPLFLTTAAYDVELAEDWQPIIEILRECLDLVLASELVLLDHAESTVQINWGWTQFAGGEGTKAKRFENDPAALFQRTFDSCNDYEIRFRGGYNHWADRAKNCVDHPDSYSVSPGSGFGLLGAAFERITIVQGVFVDVTVATIVPSGSYNAIRMGNGTTCYSTTESYCDQSYSESGVTWRISKQGWKTHYQHDGVMRVTLTEVPPAAIVGQTVNWTMTETGNGVTISASPNSGSFVIQAGQQVYDIEIVTNLVDIDFTGYDEWGAGQFFPGLVNFEPASFTLCTDFCGNQTLHE